MMNNTNKVFFNQIKVSLFFFLVSAIYGWSLRLYRLVDFISIDYKNILQAHSHVTFLGWGFLAVISSIGYLYYPKKLKKSRYLRGLFISMSVTLVGMLISFPIQGYKLFSIVFLSAFLILSYLYLLLILRAIRFDKTYSSRFIKTGIYYYYLSSLAIWVIAIVTIKFGKTTLYFNSIYFYLHFLYNGFFVFTLFGLLIKYLERKQIEIAQKHIYYFYLFTNIACIPAYTLSLLWTDVPAFVYFIGFFAAVLQLASLYYLSKIITEFLKPLSKFFRCLSIFIIGSYFLKIILQFLSVFPFIIQKAIALKPYFIIGYLHLFTLGFMSLFLLVLIQLFSEFKISKLAVKIFILGIFLSEFILFFQGIVILFFQQGIPFFNQILLFVSGLMPLGLLLIFSKSIVILRTNK